jgi:hypothetical protein
VKQGRAGIVLGAVAIALGILGIVIVNDAFEDLDEGISCLTRPTQRPRSRRAATSDPATRAARRWSTLVP